MKKSLLLVVILLTVASLMAAMAYTRAAVTNSAELKIVNTNKALVTLEDHTPWSWEDKAGAKDRTVVVKDGELFIQFGKGVDRDGKTPVFYGLQPNSVYEWNPLFTLRNKSAETIRVTVRATGELAQYITFGTCGQSTRLSPNWGKQGEPLVIENIPKEANSGMQNIRNICVKISVPSKVDFTPKQINESIIVEAVAVPK